MIETLLVRHGHSNGLLVRILYRSVYTSLTGATLLSMQRFDGAVPDCEPVSPLTDCSTLHEHARCCLEQLGTSDCRPVLLEIRTLTLVPRCACSIHCHHAPGECLRHRQMMHTALPVADSVCGHSHLHGWLYIRSCVEGHVHCESWLHVIVSCVCYFH